MTADKGEISPEKLNFYSMITNGPYKKRVEEDFILIVIVLDIKYPLCCLE